MVFFDHGGMGGFFGGYGLIFMLIGIALMVLIIVAIIRALGGSSNSITPTKQEQTDQAMRILKERFARGEINEEEFRARQRALEENGRL